MLDVLSGGRLIAGFPVGTLHGHQLLLRPDPRADPRQVPRGARADHAGLGRATEPFAFDGKYNQLRYVNCWPKPIQKPHPPIYVPGGGSIETWDFCLDHDYNYSYLSFFGYLRAKQLHGRLLGPRGRAGQGPLALPRRLRPDHLRGGDRRPGGGAVRRARASTSSTAACTSSRPSPTRPATAPSTPSSTARSPSCARTRRRSSRTSPGSSWWRSGFVIAGSPETVRQQLEECIKGCAWAIVFCLFHKGNMPDWKTRYSTKLFAEKVMPHLRGRLAGVGARRPLVVQAHGGPAASDRRPPMGPGQATARRACAPVRSG